MSRILVVDDSISIRHLIEIALQKEHHKVAVCTDGREALRYLTEIAAGKALDLLPELIISDEEMPQMLGSELAAAVRERARLKDIPFILVSANVRTKKVGELLDRKIITCFIPKPFQINQLVRLTAMCINQKKTPEPEIKEEQ